MRDRAIARLRDAHSDQQGAIALLSLAGILIILMTVMMMYDAGEAAREKVELHTGTDTAAYSHAVTKAQAMNMIAYSNIQKRIYYGYTTIYTSALLALIEATFFYTAMAIKHAASAVKALKACATLVGCPAALAYAAYKGYQALSNAVEALKGILQLVLELIEFTTINGTRIYNGDKFSFFPVAGKNNARSFKEITALNEYQGYMKKISPWWAWGEAVSRGPRNGATMVGTYPIPTGVASRLIDKANFIYSIVKKFMPPEYNKSDLYPTTSHSDGLPIENKASIIKSPPFFASTFNKFFKVPSMIMHSQMCGKMLTSPEFWVIQYFWDHWKPSEGYWDDTSKPSGGKIAPRNLVTGLEIVQLPIGCIMAAMAFGDAVLPYELSSGTASVLPNNSDEPPNSAWLRTTSIVAIGYKHGKGRMSDDDRRSKMNILSDDYTTKVEANYKNEGQWTLSRSEIFYDPGFLMKSISSPVNTIGGSLQGIPGVSQIIGGLQGFLNKPTMWAPRWSARMRPMHVPGDDLPSMRAMYHDALSLMILSAPIAWAYENLNSFPKDLNSLPSVGSVMGYFEAMLTDAYYMERAATGFESGNIGKALER